MRVFSILAAFAAFGLCACASSGGQNLGSTQPTGYVRMTEQSPFGVAHENYADGHTQIFVRMNRTGTPERARQLAFYQAARIAAHRKVASFTIVQERADMNCHHVVQRGPGVIAIGDPVTMAASLAFTAIMKSAVKISHFFAFPTHELHISFARDSEALPEAASVAVDETLARLTPVFEPDKAGGNGAELPSGDGKEKKKKTKRASRAERTIRIQNTRRNAMVCKSRFEEQQRLEKRRKEEARARRKLQREEKDQARNSADGQSGGPD